jgi:hypothetical protein
MPTTPNRGYPYPAASGAADVPYDLQRLAEAVDADLKLPNPVGNAVDATTAVTATSANTVYPGSGDISLTLTKPTLVQVIVSGTIGSGTIGAPTNQGYLAFRLSGAYTYTPSSWEGVVGVEPGITSGGSYVRVFVVPAGTLTGRLTAYRGTADIDMRNVRLDLVPLRYV